MMGARRHRVAAFPPRLPANPYCALLSAHLERIGVDVIEGQIGVPWLLRMRGAVQVLHFHWPELYFRPLRLGSAIGFAARLLFARLLGYRLVWTVHNAAPHEGATLGTRLVAATLGRVARLIVHCEAGRQTAGRAGQRAAVIPHGNYIGCYADGVDTATARARLGIEPDTRVLLAFGQVRPYKGLDELVRAFTRLAAPDARLLIAGAPVAGGGDVLGELSDPRIRVLLGHVPDDAVQLFFRAADLVVLPYRAVLSSGAAMLAFSFARGIVAPRLGCLAELDGKGAAIVYDPGTADGLERALHRAVTVDSARLGRQALRLARSLSWDTIARRHLAAYGLGPALTLARPAAGRARSGEGEPRKRSGEEQAWT
jgi:beta-1,4-mannosyltransferase